MSRLRAHAHNRPQARTLRKPERVTLSRVGEELVQVPVDHVVPDQQGDDAPEREERAERNRLLAGLAPWRAISAMPTTAPGEADQQRRRHRPAEVHAHHRDQLHVPHAHSPRIGERDEEERAAGGAAAIARSATLAGSVAARARCRPPRPASTTMFGMSRSSRSVSVIVTSTTQQDQARGASSPRPRRRAPGPWRRTARRGRPRPAGSALRSARRSRGSGPAAAARRPPGCCRGPRSAPARRGSSNAR